MKYATSVFRLKRISLFGNTYLKSCVNSIFDSDRGGKIGVLTVKSIENGIVESGWNYLKQFHFWIHIDIIWKGMKASLLFAAVIILASLAFVGKYLEGIFDLKKKKKKKKHKLKCIRQQSRVEVPVV